MTKDEICGLLRQIHDVLAMQSETNQVNPMAEQEPDDLTIAYLSGLHDGKKKRPWVDLTIQEFSDLAAIYSGMPLYLAIQSKLKEKNT